MSTDLEQRLRGAMQQFTDDVRVPPGLAAQAYRRRQKRRTTTRAVAAAGTAAAAAVAIAGAAGAFGSARPPIQTHYTAYVISHVEHALAAPSIGNLIEADRTVLPSGSTIRPFPNFLIDSPGGAGASSRWSAGYTLHWTYHRSVRLSSFTASGQHVFDWGNTQAHGTTAVIYGNHTWWTAPAIGGPDGAGPSGCVRGQAISLGAGAGNGWPTFIRSQLACGAYTVAGRQVLDGVNTIKITGASGQFTFWVNPRTYLPVQMAMGQEQTKFQWLPATPANLAQLKVTVPASFKHVPAPAVPAALAP